MTAFVPLRRVRRFSVLLMTLVVSTLLVGIHAYRARGADERRGDDRRALVEALGFADLALSSGVRWIRHPSQVEDAAPRSDLPAALDVDPAGALVGPPEAR